jgi:hypothetical protein
MTRMENPQLIEKNSLLLAGLSFFGDPFAYHMEWQVENEIGRLWTRYYDLLTRYPDFHQQAMQAGKMYEVHILHPESSENGNYEVFVGTELTDPGLLPLWFVLKRLPAQRYLQYEISGQAIVEDFEAQALEALLRTLNLQREPAYHLQAYDERFKGMDRLDESTITVLIPIREV